jgi:hypothetical protein
MHYQQLASHTYYGAAGPVSKMVSQQEKAFCVLRFEVSRSVITVQREFCARCRTVGSTCTTSSSNLCTKLTLHVLHFSPNVFLTGIRRLLFTNKRVISASHLQGQLQTRQSPSIPGENTMRWLEERRMVLNLTERLCKLQRQFTNRHGATPNKTLS